jgi:23S rRNA (cytosine1962-C5)-methyltransferase
MKSSRDSGVVSEGSSVAETRLPRLKLRLAPKAEAAVRQGHPWVFAESIRAQNREGKSGEVAVIYDRQNALLALGLYDPDSPIRVRVLHLGKPTVIDDAWWRARLVVALDRRTGLFAADTTGYRCINGESDHWPGLVLDCYDTTFVLKLYTAAWLPRLDALTALIREQLPARALVLRLSRNVQKIALERFGMSEGFLFSELDPPAETVVFLENGLRFEAAVRHGQKTGFFLDQRENRRRVEECAAGRTMLNAFSFSGGFSLYAARGGAVSVTDLDSSAPALESARRNFALNAADRRVAAARHETVRADAFDWLAHGPRHSFDLVVVDPPSLAKRESERARALETYARLNTAAVARLRRGGRLVAASCSSQISSAEFFATVFRAAGVAGRSIRECWTSGHAPDHPATFPEAQYLKCICLEIVT